MLAIASSHISVRSSAIASASTAVESTSAAVSSSLSCASSLSHATEKRTSLSRRDVLVTQSVVAGSSADAAEDRLAMLGVLRAEREAGDASAARAGD